MWYICYPDVVNMEKMAGSAWVIADMVMHFIGRIIDVSYEMYFWEIKVKL